MGFFKEVEGEAAVIVENGVYKQVPLYTRSGYLYVRVSGGFVRLLHDGSTTKAKMRLDAMSWSGSLYRDALGRLCTNQTKGAKVMAFDMQQRLLGGPKDA